MARGQRDARVLCVTSRPARITRSSSSATVPLAVCPTLRATYRLCVLWYCLATTWAKQSCLTGTMTDVQSWVDKDGRFTARISASSLVDVSESAQPLAALDIARHETKKSTQGVLYMSLARCRFREVPEVFTRWDFNNHSLAETLQYLTLYGNQFDDHQSTGDRYDSYINATKARTLTQGIGFDTTGAASWPAGFIGVCFKALRELDLRACAITTLSGGIFEGMKKLEALYLSDNSILFINAKAFSGLRYLQHLDLSRNFNYDEFGNHQSLGLESVHVMEDLENLVSLDFSYTRLSQSNLMMFNTFGKKFQRLSLCETGLSNLRGNFFANTSLRYLDVSGNPGILSHSGVLAGTQNTLEVVYAAKVGLANLHIFQRCRRLEILNVQMNEIPVITEEVAKTLVNLQVLDLDGNRINSWFDPLFEVMPNLKYLSLRNNNINMINEVMIEDFKRINYIALAGNSVICNCHSRELFESALVADRKRKNETMISPAYKNKDAKFEFHTGFVTYNNVISNRRNVSLSCSKDKDCNGEIYDNDTIPSFHLVDYDPMRYQCMQAAKGIHISFYKVLNCNTMPRDMNYGEVIRDSWIKLLALLVIPAVLFPVLAFVYVFRRNFRYFCITVRNSALLTMINKDKVIDDSRIFNYDVFVSYCNGDRGWILDQLLPHLETNCGVSVCLHERDFQVGLSILENIVSCMDRSRSIMLVISREFLLSQWCQFEMHLAQHRLLETRREDLILVLLEDIPRALRPTTLHYLMLTKTYILYPSEGDGSKREFWKRLGRSVIARRPENENDSLA